jgi:hypothetical protein
MTYNMTVYPTKENAMKRRKSCQEIKKGRVWEDNRLKTFCLLANKEHKWYMMIMVLVVMEEDTFLLYLSLQLNFCYNRTT